jgi:hypothetical protein
VSPQVPPGLTVERMPAGGGAELVLALAQGSNAEETPLVTLALVDNERVVSRRDGVEALAGLTPYRIGLKVCETWHAGLRREPLGAAIGLRVSLVCGHGEDYRVSTEIAVLFRLDAAPPRDLGALQRIWAGVADMTKSSMGSCEVARAVGFRLAGDKALEETIVEETQWVDQVIADEVKKRLRRECKVGKKKRVERLALP